MTSSAGPEAPAADVVHGVTLEQYAGIAVGLADELPLDGLLANEGIEPEGWSRAAPAWKARLGMDGAEGALFTAFCGKRCEAEDWLHRGVTPIDADLGAWLSFLRAWAAHPAPFEMLAGAGLRLNDIARLQRRWARRMAGDAALQERAAELAGKGAGPLPAIHAEPVVLKPFPWSRPRVTAPAADARPADGGDPGGLTLDRHAALVAELREPSAERARVLARHGLTAAAFEVLDAQWKQRLDGDPALERDHRRLVEHQRARLHGAAGGPSAAAPAAAPLPAPLPAPPPAAAYDLAGTGIAWSVPRGPALPFAEGAPLADIASPAAGEREAPRPHPGLGGTALALDVPRGPALPFVGAVDPERGRPASSPPSTLARTSLHVDAPRGEVLPFSADAPSTLADAPASRPASTDLSGGTALAVDVPRGPAVPFLPRAKPKPGPPRLTLEQHASLTVELAAAPERLVEALRRYGLTPVQKRDADLHYQERFAADPVLREAWELACRTYREWLLAQPGRRPSPGANGG